MIKGVNRQVIEVTDLGSIYYEKAWLVVRPPYTKVSQTILDKEAKGVLGDIAPPSAMKVKRNVLFWALRLGVSALIGAAATYALMLII